MQPNIEPEQLVEHISDWRASDLLCDAAARVVRNVALTGAVSKNGYRYTEQALRDAVALYENKPVFLDHAANLARPYERSTRDLVGTIVGPRFESGRIRGDIHALPTEAGDTFLALAERNQTAVGMSHVVLAQRGSDPAVVEKIQDVVSVDAVVFPATNATFAENNCGGVAGSEQSDGPESLGPGPSRWSDPATHVESGEHTPGADALRLAEVELQRVVAERDELRARLATVERERQVDELLRESQLPASAVSDTFRRALLAAPDRAARLALLQDRIGLWQRLSRPTPVSRERIAAEQTTADDALIRAIKRPATSVLAGMG